MNLWRAAMELRSWTFFLWLLGDIHPSWREALWGKVWLHLSMNMVEVWEVGPGELRGPSLVYWSRSTTVT